MSSTTRQFRLQAKNFFLTYPQCPISPQDALTHLLPIFEPLGLKTLIIGQEQHQDGNLHLHCLVMCAEKGHFRRASFADLPGHHGNYQACRSPTRTAFYVKKKGNFIVHGADLEPDKPAKNAQVAMMIKNGASLMEINEQFPGFCLQNLGKLQAYLHFTRACNNVKTLVPLPKISFSPTRQNGLILRWLGLNLFDPRVLRQKQLYLWGAPRMGKTTLVQTLSNSFRTYFPSHGEKYWDGFSEDHQLIVFDEFCGNVQLSMMKMILDGQEMILPCRYQHFHKTKNIPIIILSNDAPTSVYKTVSFTNLQAFIDRLFIVEISEFITIFE